MRCLVVGLGEEGSHLSRLLAQRGHDVAAIDSDPERCRALQEHVDGLVLQGNGTDPSLLLEAGVRAADLVCTVTGSDETNLVVSLLAKKLGAKKVIARLRETYWERNGIPIWSEFGVDVAIHPEWETAQEIVRLLRRSAASEVVEFSDGRVQLVGIKLDATSPWLNRTLEEISNDPKLPPFRLVAILRAAKTIIPSGQTRILRGDEVFVVARTEDVRALVLAAGKKEEKISRVMILGGGRLGRNLATLLEQDESMRVKLVESQPTLSQEAAVALRRTMVIQADGRDIDVLAQEGITDTQAFIAVTGDDETNIITSLLAKHLGVQKTITLIGRPEYLPLMTPIGLDAAVNIHTIAANTIMRLVSKAELLSAARLPSLDAEALEFVVGSDAEITHKPLRTLAFPQGALLGAVTYGDQVVIPVGDTQIAPGARVVVFCLPEAVPKVEKLLT
ncbi:MAG: Trk system potassium transporter TrkA [candidate division KSB1 bacterium]|nr:Trk system potassium transporter TrkA [candidate division KSB1 bacterium]